MIIKYNYFLMIDVLLIRNNLILSSVLWFGKDFRLISDFIALTILGSDVLFSFGCGFFSLRSGW